MSIYVFVCHNDSATTRDLSRHERHGTFQTRLKALAEVKLFSATKMERDNAMTRQHDVRHNTAA
jgi:hypothetical protein